ncbi:CU044_5270 family protein [Actinoplanes sp. NPDC049316]|uniref:CU044_5270 family protein n=1 Tax=Actinoplanes sp. NPDC049316 TaxID=3154727 RepID=UPI00342A4BD5
MNEHSMLQPPPSADLPPGRHELHKRHLMALIDDAPGTAPARARRPFLLRPVFALPALVLIVAAAVGVAVTRTGDGSHRAGPALTEPAQFADPRAGTPRGLTELADRMALVAATRDTGGPPAGGWVYIRSKTAEVYLSGDTGTAGPAARVTNRQTWRSLDGRRGWLEQTGTGEDDGGLSLDSAEPPSLTWPSYDLLTSLPTDPDALLARIRAETRDAGRTAGTGPDTEAFETVGDLLLESYPPAGLYPALYRVAASIPGALVVDDSVDAAGRHGIALARVDERDIRTELIFDKRDYTFLGERRVRTTDADGIKAGTVTFSLAVLDRSLVGAMKQVPTR